MPEGTAENATPLPPGTLLAFDFGLKRIGVAVGETLIGLAHPLTTVHGEDNDTRFGTIATLLAEWQPSGLVVGLPTHVDGTEHELTARCRRFAQQLNGRFRLPVALVDERLTSREATARLHEAGRSAKQQKAVRDQVAAQLILQAYFDGNC